MYFLQLWVLGIPKSRCNLIQYLVRTLVPLLPRWCLLPYPHTAKDIDKRRWQGWCYSQGLAATVSVEPSWPNKLLQVSYLNTVALRKKTQHLLQETERFKPQPKGWRQCSSQNPTGGNRAAQGQNRVERAKNKANSVETLPRTARGRFTPNSPSNSHCHWDSISEWILREKTCSLLCIIPTVTKKKCF